MIHYLDHQVQWPDVPLVVPSEYGFSKRRDFRLKQLLALFLASQGFSVVVEIYTMLGRFLQINTKASSLKRTISSLVENEILHTEILTLQSSYPIPLSFIRLTKRGRELCYELDWIPFESEWERMKRLHEKGKSEPAHTCATLAFTYQARLRSCRAGVVPKIESGGQFAPDAIVKKGDQQVLVEVELGYEKINKWENMHQAQGFVAFCTNSVTHRNTLKRECQSLGIPGQATDLRTLFLTSREDPPCPLWLEEWK